jgi:hypothetical protein
VRMVNSIVWMPSLSMYGVHALTLSNALGYTSGGPAALSLVVTP